MSFGQYGYQHRFFKQPVKRKAIYTPITNNVLPLQTYSVIDPNYLNTRGTTNLIHPGSSYEVLPFISPNYNDYAYNSIVLDNFKRDADERKYRRRYGSVYGKDYNYPYLPYMQRVMTQPALLPNQSVVYVNRDNPELLTSLNIQNSALIARVHEAQRQKDRANQQIIKEKQLIRNYRKKYEKLKNRIKQQNNQRRLIQMEQRRRRQIELQEQKRKMDQIQHSIYDMTKQLSNNSKILEQNLKLKQQLDMEMSKSKVYLYPTVPRILTPSIVIDKPMLNSQYKKINRLRRQIDELDTKLKASSLSKY